MAAFGQSLTLPAAAGCGIGTGSVQLPRQQTVAAERLRDRDRFPATISELTLFWQISWDGGTNKNAVGALFRALIKINYQGHVGLEYEIDADDPLPGMLQSFAYMRGVLSGIRQT